MMRCINDSSCTTPCGFNFWEYSTAPVLSPGGLLPWITGLFSSPRKGSKWTLMPTLNGSELWCSTWIQIMLVYCKMGIMRWRKMTPRITLYFPWKMTLKFLEINVFRPGSIFDVRSPASLFDANELACRVACVQSGLVTIACWVLQSSKLTTNGAQVWTMLNSRKRTSASKETEWFTT